MSHDPWDLHKYLPVFGAGAHAMVGALALYLYQLYIDRHKFSFIKCLIVAALGYVTGTMIGPFIPDTPDPAQRYGIATMLGTVSLPIFRYVTDYGPFLCVCILERLFGFKVPKNISKTNKSNKGE